MPTTPNHVNEMWLNLFILNSKACFSPSFQRCGRKTHLKSRSMAPLETLNRTMVSLVIALHTSCCRLVGALGGRASIWTPRSSAYDPHDPCTREHTSPYGQHTVRTWSAHDTTRSSAYDP